MHTRESAELSVVFSEERQCSIHMNHVYYSFKVQTRTVFQSSRSTFFMGKCGAFMLQNLVTMVKRSRANGSPLYRGEPEGQGSKSMF